MFLVDWQVNVNLADECISYKLKKAEIPILMKEDNYKFFINQIFKYKPTNIKSLPIKYNSN